MAEAGETKLTHTMTYRVSYADTDRMDRVYYANYLVIAERARTEFLRDIGQSYHSIETSGIFFPVRRCNVRYRGYAVYDDLLECRSRVGRMTHASMTLITDMYRQGENKLLVTAEVELACVTLEGKPTVLPDQLRQALLPYQKEE